MRVLTISDGFSSSSAPTSGTVESSALADYATDAAYVSAKGSAAADGDAYYNTTEDAAKIYRNGVWGFLNIGTLVSYATTAAYVTAKNSAVANGDAFYESTQNVVKIYQGSAWHFVKSGALVTYASDAAYVTGKGSAAANGDDYYNSTEHAVRVYQNGSWETLFRCDGRIGTSYLGLEAAQTTTAADSIRVTGSDGADLSSDAHHGYVVLPGTTAGTIAVFRVSANVTILLTGAHWGLGTLGDFTDVELRVYAINDNGTLKWGVSNKGGLRSITTAASSATPTDINLQTEMLVTSTLSGTSACAEIGWFNADFDDTGGAAEDLWAVQTGAGEINVGVPVRDKTDWTAFTPTGTFTTNTTYTGFWRRLGDTMEIRWKLAFAGAPNSVTLSELSLPSGYKVDAAKGNNTQYVAQIGRGILRDEGTASYQAIVTPGPGLTSVTPGSSTENGATVSFGNITQAAPYTVANTDQMNFNAEVPVLGWSSN